MPLLSTDLHGLGTKASSKDKCSATLLSLLKAICNLWEFKIPDKKKYHTSQMTIKLLYAQYFIVVNYQALDIN